MRVKKQTLEEYLLKEIANCANNMKKYREEVNPVFPASLSIAAEEIRMAAYERVLRKLRLAPLGLHPDFVRIEAGIALVLNEFWEQKDTITGASHFCDLPVGEHRLSVEKTAARILKVFQGGSP